MSKKQAEERIKVIDQLWNMAKAVCRNGTTQQQLEAAEIAQYLEEKKHALEHPLEIRKVA